MQNDAWFGEDAIRENWKQGPLTLSLSMAFHIGTIYLGYLSLKYRPKADVTYIYNTVIIGFIGSRIFQTFEIFKRMTQPFGKHSI